MKQSLVRCITYNYYPNRTDSNAADRKVIAFSRRGSLRSSNFSIFRFFDGDRSSDRCDVVMLRSNITIDGRFVERDDFDK